MISVFQFCGKPDPLPDFFILLDQKCGQTSPKIEF
jgi:hypothetical protein